MTALHSRSIPVLLLVGDGAPAVEPLLVGIEPEGFELAVSSAQELDGDPPPPGIVVLWTRSGLDDRACERAVEWCRRRPGVGLVGCAPLGTSLDCELALAAGFDDFMAGRSSPRELAARIRSVARRVAARGNRCRVVATPSTSRHARGGT